MHGGCTAENIYSEILTPESTVNVRLNCVLNFLFDKRWGNLLWELKFLFEIVLRLLFESALGSPGKQIWLTFISEFDKLVKSRS